MKNDFTSATAQKTQYSPKNSTIKMQEHIDTFRN